jgi:hypothetical protein
LRKDKGSASVKEFKKMPPQIRKKFNEEKPIIGDK